MTFNIEMDDFDIAIEADSDDPDVESGVTPKELRGRHGLIQLGESEEEFISSLEFWEPEQYRAQWREAVARVVFEAKDSCLITSLADPADSEGLTWCTMHPRGDIVYVRTGICLFSQAYAPFDLANPHASVWPREAEDEDVLEWEVSLGQLREFLVRQSGSAWRPNDDFDPSRHS